MVASSLIGRLLPAGRIIAGIARQVAPLVARVLVAQAIAPGGLGKLQHPEVPTAFFADLGIPMPHANALLVGFCEFLGGLCLLLGLGTRVWAGVLIGLFTVALLTAHRADIVPALAIGGEKGLLDILVVPFLALLVWLVAHGPGLISVDTLIARWWRRRTGAGRPAGHAAGA